MKDVIYMLGVVAVGFAVNYALRALPFILFAGRDRELPRWVERFGAFVSPVIIAGLIVYSYSGLEWKTVYPYLAGAIVMVQTFLVEIGILLADIGLAFLDPRIRFSGGSK